MLIIVLKHSDSEILKYRDFLLKENADYSLKKLEKHERALEREIEQMKLQSQNSDGEGKEEGTGEKWKPSLEEKIKTQDIREKVYSEFIDRKKIEAFKEGDISKYNTTELEFLKKYKKVALDPNLNSTDGSPYRDQTKEDSFSEDIVLAREDHKRKMKNVLFEAKLENKMNQMSEMKIDRHSIEQNDKIYKEPREDMQKLHDQYKSSIRENNEEFFYRYEYAKRHPELRKAINQEESINTKAFKKVNTDELAFEKGLRAQKDSWAISDRKLGSYFSENLKKGDIVKGLLQRKEQLKKEQLNKDLSEIAIGNDQDSQDLYKKYMSYERPQRRLSKEEEIAERERDFLEAVERNYQKTSPTAQKTFQDYEEYKRRIQTEVDEYEGVDNDVTQIDHDFSTRDWYSKVWTGKITNKEFEDYMYDSKKVKDKLGYDKVIYAQKENPGYGKNDFVSFEDKERIYKELIEVKRRKSVLQGLCTEAESHKYVEQIGEGYNEIFSKMSEPQVRENMDEYLEIIKAAIAGEQVREYYFDPNQGVSLEEHLESVKKVYPDAKIESY